MYARFMEMSRMISQKSRGRFVELPRDHFVHLKELAAARKEDIFSTVCFLMARGRFNEENWLYGRYKGNPNERHRLYLPKGVHVDPDILQAAIQALPRWIKSKTDFPLSEDYSFHLTADGVQSVTLNGRTFFDRTPVGSRERAMYDLLADRFVKPMSLQEFQILTVCQSQYAILLEEPDRYVMPKPKQTCVDAGSFVGYKAMAMADVVGPEGKVLAVEMDEDSFGLQQRCFSANKMEGYLTGVNAALDETECEREMLTSVKGSMQNSLARFDEFAVNSSRKVQTRRLESILEEAGISYVDSLHVSVNGHEAQVLKGLGSYARKVGTYCVMVPYRVDGVKTTKMVKDFFDRNGIRIWGRSQAAIVAGPDAEGYPVQPLSAN